MQPTNDETRRMIDGLLDMMTAEEQETIRKIAAALIRNTGNIKRSG